MEGCDVKKKLNKVPTAEVLTGLNILDNTLIRFPETNF